jgi:hypothetical protein
MHDIRELSPLPWSECGKTTEQGPHLGLPTFFLPAASNTSTARQEKQLFKVLQDG